MLSKDMAEQVASRAGDKPAGGVAGAGSNDEWVGIQKKTFTNWVNAQLAKIPEAPTVNVLEEDLKDGTRLIQLLEVCSEKAFGRYNKGTTMKIKQLENLTNAFKFMEKEGLKLVNLGPVDVNDGNLKLELGLIWTIIYHYQISKSFKEAGAVHGKKGGAKDILLRWVQSKIPEYNITNFNTDWNDGRAICALTNVIAGEPYVLPNHRQMPPEAGSRNARQGIDAAHEYLAIPKLIAPEDMANPAIDDLSVMTYVSYFKDASRVKKDKSPMMVRKESAPAFRVGEKSPTKLPDPEPAKEPGEANPSGYKGPLPPPWERKGDWREYKGADLGGRCKIRGFYSTTTSSHQIRTATRDLQMLLERFGIHKRPDFVPWTPIDVDMDPNFRAKLFEKAGTKMTPMLFVDDEYIGSWERIQELNETGELASILNY
eukprot:m.292944 g.292944  ORF g.292944 m.292944 type:complete len:428 (-) comp12702_c0_seq1:210-1493(-)